MTGSVDEILQRAATCIGTDTGASLVLRHGAGLTRISSSDARSARCDDVEIRERQGPCMLAMDQLAGVLVPGVVDDDRWPAWRDETVQVGFRSAAALPAYVGAGAVVALNLYSEELDPWDAQALVRADVHVQEIATILARRLGDAPR